MKKLFFTGLIVSLFVSSCTNTKKEEVKTSATTEKNLEAVRGINKAIETGDVSKLGDYIAEDGVDHAGMKGDIVGLDSIKTELAKIHTMATGMKMQIIKELADSEYVFQWMKISGTTATPDMGIPVGTPFEMNAIQVSKFRDGKAVEHWEFMLPAEMMKMIAPGMDNKMDSVGPGKRDLKLDKKAPINKIDTRMLEELKKDSTKN